MNPKKLVKIQGDIKTNALTYPSSLLDTFRIAHVFFLLPSLRGTVRGLKKTRP